MILNYHFPCIFGSWKSENIIDYGTAQMIVERLHDDLLTNQIAALVSKESAGQSIFVIPFGNVEEEELLQQRYRMKCPATPSIDSTTAFLVTFYLFPQFHPAVTAAQLRFHRT